MFTPKVLASLVATLSAFALGAARLQCDPGSLCDYVSKWVNRPVVLFPALLSISLWSIYKTFDEALAGVRAKEKTRLDHIRNGADQLLKSTLVHLQRLTDLPFPDLGLHLFLVTKPKGFRQPLVQQHILRVKLSSFPPSTGITWTSGKGVIGLCWSSRAFQAHDLHSAYLPYAHYSEAQWNGLPARQRFGLTFEEFTRTSEYAGTIFAAPILADMGQKYLGCVSLDAPGPSFQRLNTFEVKESLQVVADAVRNFLRPHGPE